MIDLTLLHINDLHGRVAQLSRIATLVRRIRREVEAAGGYCLFVDAGDSEDTTLLECSLTKGSAMEAILRGAGCDYVALGNAVPIRYGQQAVANLARSFGRPLLCANMKEEDGRLVEGLQSFAIETSGSLCLGLVGLTAPMESYSIFKLRMEQPEAILPGLITEVKEQGARTILLLSHLASAADLEAAEKIEGIDVIIGAHDHRELDPPLLVKNTIIAQAGDFGRFLGRLDLKIDPDTGKVLQHEGRLIPITEDIPLDPQTQRAFETERIRVRDEIVAREIGTLSDPIELFDDCECAAGNLLADALLERIQGAELALVLTGHWETGLDAGVLTHGALFAAIRSAANPARVELTGEQIIQFLRAALKPENAARQPRELRGRPVGTPHLAGARAIYSADLERIDVEINGKPLETERRYIVAATDVELSGYVNYLVIPDGEIEYEVPTIMPEVLEDYVARHSPVQSPDAGRIRTK